MSKRIFIASPLSAHLHKTITHWQQTHASLPARFVAPENLHVTLVPPWEEHNVNSVITKLRQARLGVTPFSLQFDRIVLGPNQHSLRMIWVKGPTPPELMRLKYQVEQTLGIKSVDRPFKLHVTLARFRPEDYQNFPRPNINEVIDWQENINSFALMQSFLLPQGVKYQTLEQFLL
jgi:RNA 2',3'-cyclic 3'-phosphodiesterase